MNAPFRHAKVAPDAAVRLHLFALFHLNLAFSSIEEEQRGEAIRRCYWPLLDLAQDCGPIGLELSGYTLEEIAARDPEWIGRARALIAKGRIELIGSGFTQMIGPLVPARVTEWNLKLGNATYEKYLGVRPALALVNEQAYAAGLVDLYLDAGYRAILMDWDNPGAHHPEWPAETRYLPQRAVSPGGRTIGLLWTSTVAFQKLQRFVHGDIALDDYLAHLRGKATDRPRTYCLYASDAEVFDFRPGRYKTEDRIAGGEWKRLTEAFHAAGIEPGAALVSPSQALSLIGETFANQALHLQSPECPVPVKKQRKYNLSRWAVTGRDDIAVNAACQRIYESLVASDADADAWKELCVLWSSDFRTHITERRWHGFCGRLKQAEARYAALACRHDGAASARSIPLTPTLSSDGGDSSRHLQIETSSVFARLDRRRGLAVERLRFQGHARASVGGLPHGFFDDISLQADWYTGDCVFEAPGEHKVTDLEWCDARVARMPNGGAVVAARIDTPKGAIDKRLSFAGDAPRVDFDLTFHWPDWGKGSLRLGHITLLPDAFDLASLSLTTHNGGKVAETFSLNGRSIEHGAPVSFLVSSSQGLGLTEGWAELGDAKTRIRVTVDRATAPLLGLLTHKRIGDSVFCQLMLSALELDETRKPCAYAHGPRRFRFSLSAAKPH